MKREMEERMNRLSLIVQYYRCAANERQAEIDTCLRNNLLNPYLTDIHLLTEELFDVSSFPNNEKIVQTVIGERLTYKRAFEYAGSIDGDVVWLLANADIYFDDSLRHLDDISLKNVMYALSRHDILPDGTNKFIDEEYAHGSQDVWIFKTPLNLAEMFTDFNLGVPGCDNRIAYEIIKAGYLLVNPGKIIKCYHLDLTKETDIVKRTAEYMKMHSNDSVAEMKIAPPPYQFYIFPTNTLGVENIDIYRKFLDKMIDMTTVNNNLIDCHNHVKELEQRIDEQRVELESIIASRDYTIASLLNSMSWKITAPLRKLIDIFK